MLSDKDKKKASLLRKQRLNLLQSAINKARIDLSMYKLKTWDDVYNVFGIPNAYAQIGTPSIKEFNEFAFKIEDELRRKLAAEAAAIEKGESPGLGGISAPPTDDQFDDEDKTLDVGIHDVHPMDKFHKEWMPECPKQKAILKPFQLKAAKDMMWKFFVDRHRAHLRRAPVGSGKTFMYGQVLSWLWNMKPQPWFQGKTFSPIPALIVTKATIVEQTSRVMRDLFGLDPIRQVRVLHYDALRSSIGERLLASVKIVEDATVRIRWKWHLGLNPLFFVFDECQSAKNEDSQQSRITQAVSELKDPNIKVLFTSATPFLRVYEAKYFVINANIEYSIL